MKSTIILALVASMVLAASLALGWDDNRWEIIKSNPYGNSQSSTFGTDVEMKKKYDYDPANKYRGNIDNSGDIRMRDYNGNTLRGNIDNDGYGRLRDQDGNTFRIRPR